MARSQLLAASIALVAALAACGQPSPGVSDDLERDLAAVRASSVDLAPRAPQRTMVVSAEEQGRAATLPPATRPVAERSRPAAVPRPRVAAAAPQPMTEQLDEVVASGTTPVAAAPEASTPIVSGPLRRPVAPTPEPPGGYRSVEEVIRNAPFPIKP